MDLPRGRLEVGSAAAFGAAGSGSGSFSSFTAFWETCGVKAGDSCCHDLLGSIANVSRGPSW